MKSIKTYLLVVTTLLVVAIGFGVYVWYTVQTLDKNIKEVESSRNVPVPDAQIDMEQGMKVDKDS